jgi:Glyoxalase/Bleomycin resistance protein/Dioxygenase superfamily
LIEEVRKLGNGTHTLIGAAMMQPKNIGILFIAGFGPIVADRAVSRSLYGEALGIQFKEEGDGYLHTESLQGAKTFALWPLSQAAHSCFGTESWPPDIPTPQAWLEFDVESVEEATAALEQQGYRMLVKNKKEPWGQTVSRFLSPEGLLIGIAFTPFFREKQ